MRDKVTEVVGASLPHMKAWLANPETWKNEPALAARAWLQAAEWAAPKFGRADPHADGSGIADMTAREIEAAAKAAPILSQAEAGRAYQEMISGGAGAAVAAERLAQARPIEPVRVSSVEPDVAFQDPDRYAGIPLPEGGTSYLPAPPPIPQQPDAEPVLPRPAIDVRPSRRECLPIEAFDANGCLQADDPGIGIAFRGMSHLNR